MIIHIIISYKQNISLIFYVKDGSHMSGFDIRLVFSLTPRDNTLQFIRCVYLWNNFPCIKSLILLVKLMWISKGSLKIIWFMTSLVNRFWSFLKEFTKNSKIVLCYDRCNTFVFGPFFAYIFCQDQNLT